MKIRMASEVPIQVAIRVRPLLGNEINRGPCLYCIPDQPQIILGKSKNFTFDYVFPQDTSQKSVYTTCVQPLISVYFEGYNTTVFAYGQTGSGKTYTMATGNRAYLDEEECGIIPRAVTDIFNTMEKISDRYVCKLRVSFIEVYKEELKDLLENSTANANVQVMDDENGNTVVMGVQEEVANNVDDVLTLLDAGTAMRHVGSTNMNEKSSRSHCIFTMILDQYPIVETNEGSKGKKNLCSRFHFVDLAGSERAQRTGNQGERFKESISINTGLLALGNVISALAEKKEKHVPYRESKLTRLLKDSLGGNSRTLMIACLSPAIADLDENINSLKYAERANSIRNTPVVNFNMEKSKITRMETELETLREQLIRRQSTFLTQPADIQKISDLEIENEKREVEQNIYLQQLHEINVMLQAIEITITLPPALKSNLDSWRKNWQKYTFARPITAPAPSRGSSVRRPQNDIVENLRNELTQLKQKSMINNDLLDSKTRELEKVQEELCKLREVNAELNATLNADNKKTQEYQEKMIEQQLIIEGFRSHTAGSVRKSFFEERPSQNGIDRFTSSTEERVMQSFRAKSELLISQVNDLDNVEYDDHISSDEENNGEFVEKHWNGNGVSTPPLLPQSKTFVSLIPRPSKLGKHTPKQTKQVSPQNGHTSSSVDDESFQQLESGRLTARDGARTAEMNVREVSNKMKELEENILLKESLIEDLMKSEKEARATSSTFKDKLHKLEKDYEKSKRELDEAQDKINQFEKSNSKDSHQKTKLENDLKKKYKEMQKKYEDMKQKENVSNRITTYQVDNEKKVKDLEGWIARMKNQHIELDRKLKEESEKKSKYEQEIRKNEIRIKELELKTDQQSKLLKRKNEEVVAAQRKLRIPSESAKGSDVLEQKKQWIDTEIDKIMARQRDMEALEAELRQRDESLKKKETLLAEKEQLEMKRIRSSNNLSKSIMQLSVQVESVDEKIQELTSHQNRNKFSKDLQQLERVKDDLTNQRKLLIESQDTGGLNSNEARRLIEIGEAIEAVDEAIQFKNDIIIEKQSSINGGEINNPDHVNRILNEMGDLTSQEYKHLLGKQFFKIIELRKTTNLADEARYDYEMKISEQERKIYDMQRLLQVSERRHEKILLEQNSKHEKDIQFLMTELRLLAADGTTTKENIPLEKKVNLLEKELYYYKAKSRKYKEHLKDSNDRDEINSREGMERKGSSDSTHGSRNTNTRESLERKGSNDSNHSSRNDGGEELRLPNISSHNLVMKKDSSEKKLVEHHNAEDAKRLKEIFESKAPSSPSSNNSSKRNGKKKHKDDIYQGSIVPDSMEVSGKNPWIH